MLPAQLMSGRIFMWAPLQLPALTAGTRAAICHPPVGDTVAHTLLT